MSARLTLVQRLLLAAYPPHFRERYGEELSTLVGGTAPSPRLCADLCAGALRAWLRPRVAGDAHAARRWRLEATTATAFVVWCAALLAMAGFSRAVDDPPLDGLRGGAGQALFRASGTAFTVSAVVIAGGMLLYLVIVLLPAIRSGRREVWAPVALATAAVAACAVLAPPLSWLVQRYANAPHPPTPVIAAVGVLVLGWAGLCVLTLAGCALGAVVALRRARLRSALLVPGVLGAAVVAAATSAAAVGAAGCLAVLESAHPLAATDLGPAALGVGMVALAALSGSVSAVRGVAALRVRTPA